MLVRETHGTVACYLDRDLLDATGILVAFTERCGGHSQPPYASLNLAGHVGDDAPTVDRNRDELFGALGLERLREALVTAEQVHGTGIARVRHEDAGRGARASRGAAPIAGADALWTTETGIPLMLLFADCVPVILVHPSTRTAAVVHAGWRGVLAGLAGTAVRTLGEACGGTGGIRAYVGPHIHPCCYEVERARVSQFGERFATLSRASDRLDLAAAVAEDLDRAGVAEERQCHLGICTAHNTEHFYSYRAEGRTGRHAALAVVVPSLHS